MAMFVLLVILIILFMYKIISSQSLSAEGHWAVCKSYQLPVEQEEGSRAMVTKKFVLLKCGYPFYKVGISPPFHLQNAMSARASLPPCVVWVSHGTELGSSCTQCIFSIFVGSAAHCSTPPTTGHCGFNRLPQELRFYAWFETQEYFWCAQNWNL